jgi:hypothetical protein
MEKRVFETVLEENVEKRMSETELEEDASIPEKDVSIHDVHSTFVGFSLFL